MATVYIIALILLFSIENTVQNDFEQCPPLPMLELTNGNISVLPNSRISFHCEEGYSLLGPSIMRCYNGNWTSNQIPRCRRPLNTCYPPEPIENGKIWGSSWHFGNEIYYICDSGYSLLGNRIRTCLRNRYWSGTIPFCQANSEPLINVATRIKDEFVTKMGNYSIDSRTRAIGSEILKIGLELILIIDRSSSIDPVEFKRGIKFTEFLLDEFGVKNGKNNEFGTRIAVITFGDIAKIEINVDSEIIQNKEDAKKHLNTLKPEGGGTAMENALSIIFPSVIPLLRAESKRVIFLLTDGKNNIGVTGPDEIAHNLKKWQNFEIFTVGIGQDIDKDELVNIASEPSNNHVFLLNKYSDLDDIMWLIRNTPEENPLPGPEICGYLPETKKNVLPKWPWLAIIYIKYPLADDSYKMGFCSGSLICSQWVLTSASCFYGEDKEDMQLAKKHNVYVSLGKEILAVTEKTEKNFFITRLVFHPSFNPWKNYDDDLALIKLNEPAPMHINYRPICLPSLIPLVLTDINTKFFMAGWGNKPSESFFKGKFTSSFVVSSSIVKAPITTFSECNKIRTNITSNMFCAGLRYSRSCAGNLGSPLVAKEPDTDIYYLLGVLTKREFCATNYNVFIEVRKYLNWINSVTKSCQQNHQR